MASSSKAASSSKKASSSITQSPLSKLLTVRSQISELYLEMSKAIPRSMKRVANLPDFDDRDDIDSLRAHCNLLMGLLDQHKKASKHVLAKMGPTSENWHGDEVFDQCDYRTGHVREQGEAINRLTLSIRSVVEGSIRKSVTDILSDSQMPVPMKARRLSIDSGYPLEVYEEAMKTQILFESLRTVLEEVADHLDEYRQEHEHAFVNLLREELNDPPEEEEAQEGHGKEPVREEGRHEEEDDHHDDDDDARTLGVPSDEESFDEGVISGDDRAELTETEDESAAEEEEVPRGEVQRRQAYRDTTLHWDR
ncbi:hypothetical protein PMZ80_002484 [Knufia obscura]|uniref:Uncharacterized protein n=2 Tax=Knufia TaxID=430999 RepID=A0AAN8EB88_9EURO|nr:hypothetical protein PMZ80_002484 [Knufia obscura]KAK5950808.1 hypothetical protein OHC33_008191 [Knufia fluminis]